MAGTEDQYAPCPVTDEMLKAWTMMADVQGPLRPGAVNWVMMVRSLIAEIERLKR
jgi:hypothetical protein